MYKNETEKMNAHVVIVMQALYGVQCRYDETHDKDGLANDLGDILKYCNYYNLFDYDTDLLPYFMEILKGDHYEWQKERLTKE